MTNNCKQNIVWQLLTLFSVRFYLKGSWRFKREKLMENHAKYHHWIWPTTSMLKFNNKIMNKAISNTEK